MSLMFRNVRRSFKSKLPYVRRRVFKKHVRLHERLESELEWRASGANTAKLCEYKKSVELTGEVAFFVTHAPDPQLKKHVVEYVQALAELGVSIVLIVNTDQDSSSFYINADVEAKLAGIYFRENIGFDFAAWAHVFCEIPDKSLWSRLYFVNDSLVGPLNKTHLATIFEEIRLGAFDVYGLTDNYCPYWHMQSFFFALDRGVVQSEVFCKMMLHTLNFTDKQLVIDFYELKFANRIKQLGFTLKVLFPSLVPDPLLSNRVYFAWQELVLEGFPFVKTSVIKENLHDALLQDTVPEDFLAKDF